MSLSSCSRHNSINMTPTRTPNRPREATMLNISFLFALDVDRYRVKPNKPYHRQAISNLGRLRTLDSKHTNTHDSSTPACTAAAWVEQERGLQREQEQEQENNKYNTDTDNKKTTRATGSSRGTRTRGRAGARTRAVNSARARPIDVARTTRAGTRATARANK